jgi:tetratricopeptide (TPR) repeat protein
VTTIEPPSVGAVGEDNWNPLAEQVADAATSTGLGFLLARLVTDRILDGSLDPQSHDFQGALYRHAGELLLDDPSSATTERALLQASSAVWELGIPIGSAWEAAAKAIEPASTPGLDAQLALVQRLNRFLVEQQVEGDVLYRLFHPSLRDYFSQGLVQWNDPVAAVDDNTLHAVAAALTELWQSNGDTQVSAASSRFLERALPRLLARVGERGLLSGALEGSSQEFRERVVDELIAAGRYASEAGNRELALHWIDLGGDLAQSDRSKVEVLLALSDIYRRQDNWREARDHALRALDIARDMSGADPVDLEAVRSTVSATTAAVSAFGVGAFDAGSGVELADETLELLAGLPASVLVSLAGDVADLLLVYPRFLNIELAATERLPAAAAAHSILSDLVEAGAADREPALALARCLEATCRLDAGQPEGLTLLRSGVDAVLADAPVRGRLGLDSLAFTGEITQRLGIAGLHTEARSWIERGLDVWERLLRAYESDDRAKTVVALGLRMRSAVLAVLGEADAALADARRAASLVGLEEAAIPLASRLLDANQMDELMKITADWPDLGPSWWSRVARSDHAVHEGAIEPAAQELQETLDVLERVTITRPDIMFREFIDYEPELRTASALARVWTAADNATLSNQALAQGAQVFLRRVGLRSPRCVLHVQPDVLEIYTRVWSPALLPEWQPSSLAAEWRSALRLLQELGREALAERYQEEPLVSRPELADDSDGHVEVEVIAFADEQEDREYHIAAITHALLADQRSAAGRRRTRSSG